jgi:phosphate transport system protein
MKSSTHLHRDLERIKQRILGLGGLVESALERSTRALSERNVDLARDVIEEDDEIDHVEVEIEEECMKALALHQPVANDLRLIVTILKVNNDLERMGDHASDIAGLAIRMAPHASLPLAKVFSAMAGAVRRIVANSLDALVRGDAELAHAAIGQDDAIDAIHRNLFAQVEELVRADPSSVERAIPCLSVSRHLERIADLATNIAEDTIFMVQAKVVRHGMTRTL